MTAKTSDRESRLKINQFMFISQFLKTCVLSVWTYNQWWNDETTECRNSIMKRRKFAFALGNLKRYTMLWCCLFNGRECEKKQKKALSLIKTWFLITLSPDNARLLRPTVFFWPKPISKVAITKTKSATIAFFLFSSFPSPCSFFCSFPFPFYCEFEAFRS